MSTSTFAKELQELIDRSHSRAWEIFEVVRSSAEIFGPQSASKWRSPGEPAYVSMLLEQAMHSEGLRESIMRNLRPKGLCDSDPLLSGIFIHQKPKVQFEGSTDQIELGDLLLVRHHFRSGAEVPEGRAVLLQAKSARKPITGKLKKNEAHQFDLYSNWKKAFSFPNNEVGLPPDGSSHWNFEKGPGMYANSGEYGIVSSLRSTPVSFPDRSAWAVGAAKPTAGKASPSVTGSRSLAVALEEFLLGRWGRPWHTISEPNDHWSTFVIRCLAAAIGWRNYPIQRLNSDFPRARDLMSLFFSLADAGIQYGYDWERKRELPRWMDRISSNPNRDLSHRIYEQCKRAERIFFQTDICKRNYWSYDPPFYGDEGEPRGISVLYIATSGDVPLEDLSNDERSD